jgi:hypothetical protein
MTEHSTGDARGNDFKSSSFLGEIMSYDRAAHPRHCETHAKQTKCLLRDPVGVLAVSLRWLGNNRSFPMFAHQFWGLWRVCLPIWFWWSVSDCFGGRFTR